MLKRLTYNILIIFFVFISLQSNAQNIKQPFIFANAFESHLYSGIFMGLNNEEIEMSFLSYGGGIRRLTKVNDFFGVGIGVDYRSQVFKHRYTDPILLTTKTVGIHNPVISVPIYFKLLFAKKFHFNPEFSFDIELKDAKYHESQTGLSAGASFGRYFYIDRNLWLNIEIESKITSCVAFNSVNPEQLISTGLRIGIFFSKLK